MTVTDAILVPLLRSDPATPRITHYDDAWGSRAGGSRVELSGATAANWAAKTANWLRDGLGLAPGDRTAVLLPAHWQSAGVLFGAWWCGAVVTADPDGAAVALCAPDGVAAATGADEVAVVSLDPLGAGVTHPPAGVLDYTGEVRAHGDTFRPPALAPAAPATEASTVDELVADARRRAVELGLRPGDRVLSTLGWRRPGELVDGLLAVLAADASLVQCTNPDGAVLPRRVLDERVTATLGVDVPGVRRSG